MSDNCAPMENFGLWQQIQEAINTIKRGVCKRIDVNDQVKVYLVKNVIRIDIKEEA